MGLSNARVSSFPKRAPYCGPSSSEHFNDVIETLVSDISNISSDWNNVLKPLINSLPGGGETKEHISVTPNAFNNGLDGSNLYLDSNATETSGGYFYSPTYRRPLSIKESIQELYTKINEETSSLRIEINDILLGGSVLTTAQKNRIGASIFFSGSVSAASSLEGRILALESASADTKKAIDITAGAWTLVGPGDYYYDYNHNFNTRDVFIFAYGSSDYLTRTVEIYRYDADNVRIISDTAEAMRVVMLALPGL